MTETSSPRSPSIILPSIMALLGVLLGSFLSSHNSLSLLQAQRRYELQEKSYASLMGLSVSGAQAMHTLAQAKVLSEYYNARYTLFSHAPSDNEESKRQYARAIDLIPTYSSQEQALFQALADARLSLPLDTELETAIDALYQPHAIDIKRWDTATLKTPQDLDAWKLARDEEVEALLHSLWTDKIDALLPLLLKRIKNERP